MIDLRDVQFLRSVRLPRDFPHDGRPQVCFAGRSNVGKSSLLNVLVGRSNLARTSKTPGRTREINFFQVAERLYLVDLPGYGYAKVSRQMRQAWGRLIEAYFADNEALRLTVVILDVRRDPTEDDLELIGWLEDRSIPYVLVLTKSDKVSGNGFARQSKRIGQSIRQRLAEIGLEPDSDEPLMIRFSAKTGRGRPELVRAILDAVGRGRSGQMRAVKGP